MTFKFWKMLQNVSEVTLVTKNIFVLKILNSVQSFVECKVSLVDDGISIVFYSSPCIHCDTVPPPQRSLLRRQPRHRRLVQAGVRDVPLRRRRLRRALLRRLLLPDTPHVPQPVDPRRSRRDPQAPFFATSAPTTSPRFGPARCCTGCTHA